MRPRIIVPSLLLSLLVSFVVWAIAWTVQGRSELTYNVGPASVSMILVDSMPALRPSAAISEFNSALAEFGVGVIMDGAGNGYPGLTVFDPSNKIGWLQKYSGQITASQHPKVILFRGSYCAARWAATRSCPLLPPDAVVIGTVSPPTQVAQLQFVRVPSQAENLPPGRYIFSDLPDGFLAGITPVFGDAGLKLREIAAPAVLLELVANPLIVVSAALLALGSCAAAIHWRAMYGGRSREVRLRHDAGASPRILVLRGVQTVLPAVTLSAFGGAVLSGILVSSISGTPLEPEVYSWLFLSAVVSALLLLAVTYGVQQIVVRTAVKEPPSA